MRSVIAGSLALIFVVACSGPMSGANLDGATKVGSRQVQDKPAAGGRQWQDEGEVTLLKAVNGAGRPLARVRVISFGTAIEGTSVREIGTTNRGGLLRTEVAEPPFLGFAPDGRAAVTINGQTLVFGKVADLVIRARSENGRPLAGRLVTLIPTQDNQPLKNYGSLTYLRGVSEDVQRLVARTTDSHGMAVFHKMPIRGKFSVLLSSTPPSDTLFEGSVKPGKIFDLLIARDREISGYVYDGKMRPIANAELGIDYSSFSAMAPDQSFRTTKTDALGHYQIQGLPNCRLGVSAGAPGVWVANARVDGGEWLPTGLVGNPAPGWDSVMCYESGTSDKPQDRMTHIDFRLDKPIKVHVSFTNPHHVALDNFAITAFPAGQKKGIGTEVYSGIQNLQNTFGVGQGKYDLVLASPGSDIEDSLVLRTIDAHEGDSFDFNFEVPAKIAGRHARWNISSHLRKN